MRTSQRLSGPILEVACQGSSLPGSTCRPGNLVIEALSTLRINDWGKVFRRLQASRPWGLRRLGMCAGRRCCFQHVRTNLVLPAPERYNGGADPRAAGGLWRGADGRHAVRACRPAPSWQRPRAESGGSAWRHRPGSRWRDA